MKVATVSLSIIAAIALTGCGTTTGERTGSGALLGAGTGASPRLPQRQRRQGRLDWRRRGRPRRLPL